MLRQRLKQSDSEHSSSSSSLQPPSSPSSSSTKLPLKKPMDTKYSMKSRRRINLCQLVTFFLGLVVFVAYVAVPIAFKFSPTFRRHLLFMNYVNFQMNMNLSNPESEYNLKCAKVFSVASSDGISLGAWHILPNSLVSKHCPTGSGLDLSDVDASRLFDDDRPIVLYVHGNGGTRGGNHRLGLYRMLAYGPLDAHVITFDYRGYGDSAPIEPSVAGIIDDAYHMYRWLSSKVNHSRINIWGHSLGTAVSVAIVKNIGSTSKPNTLTLEAPFNKAVDTIPEYPLAIIYKFYPLFDYFFVEPFRQPEYQMLDSQSNIKYVHVPLLILHAKDDAIVPFKLGHILYQKALEASKDKPENLKPVMVVYQESHGYGHKNIYKEPSLTQLIKLFFSHQPIKKTLI